MPQITLPDGSERSYDAPVTGFEIAESIGRKLAKAALAVRVNDELWDTTRKIESDSTVPIITNHSNIFNPSPSPRHRLHPHHGPLRTRHGRFLWPLTSWAEFIVVA